MIRYHACMLTSTIILILIENNNIIIIIDIDRSYFSDNEIEGVKL